MSGKIFINYRRGDDAGFTQALYLRLEDAFPADDLFMDVEGHIKPGDDFVEVLNAQVGQCDVLLVIIGARWGELLAERAGSKDDFVAIEIKAALEQGKRVIPVLVGGASMPRPETLPEAIRPLARRNAVGLRSDRFKADCQGLVAALREQLAASEQERAARTLAERQAAEAARRQAEEQAAARARATEERGQAKAAAGLSAAEIRKAEELANWDFVKDNNDIQDLRDHLARYQGGTTERYALSKLEALVWAGLGSAASAAHLQAYLDEFPKGANADAARTRIAALEQKAAAAQAEAARRRAETEAWGAIASSTSKDEIEAFLKAWPDGQHTTAALRRLTELHSKGSFERLVSVSPVLACAVLGAIGGALAGGPLVTATLNIGTTNLLVFPSIFAGLIVGVALFVWARIPGRQAIVGGLACTLLWAATDLIGMANFIPSTGTTPPWQLFAWGAMNAIGAVAAMLMFVRSRPALGIAVATILVGGVASLVFIPKSESEFFLSQPAMTAVAIAPIMALIGLLSTKARRKDVA